MDMNLLLNDIVTIFGMYQENKQMMDISKRNLDRIKNVVLSKDGTYFVCFGDKDIARLHAVVSEICSRLEHTTGPVLQHDYVLYKHLLDILEKEE